MGQLALDKEARLRLWAGNLGAHRLQGDHKSAAYRLRNAPEVANRILKVLADLLEVLQDIHAILSGAREERIAEPNANGVSAQEGSPVSELSELWLMVDDEVTSLMRMSVIIHRSSERDRHARAAQVMARHHPFDTSYDVDYVRHKYPKLEESPWLLRRVGEAITTRRQFLAYARDHHLRIAYAGTDYAGAGDGGRPIPPGNEEVPTVYSQPTTRPTLASTMATTLVIEAGNLKSALRQLDHVEVEDTASQASSFVSSQGEGIENANLRLIRLREVAPRGGPFECRYCHRFVAFKSERSWR